jgi:ribonuclease-3
MQKKLGLTPIYEFDYDEEKDRFTAYLCVPSPEFKRIFWGNGASKSIAREEAAYSVWAYIQEHHEARAIAPFEVTKETAINTLQELAQKGYIEFPEYDFSSYGADHIPSWQCTCTLPERGYNITASSTNKKEAKHEAAYKMLLLLKKEV